MGKAKSSFNRELDVMRDKHQFVFAKSGDVAIQPNPSTLIKIEPPKLDFTKNVTCPFCLSWLPVGKFIISNGKKGYRRDVGQCPVCKNKPRLRTLFGLSKMTPQTYAKFIVDYPAWAFWKKVEPQFEEWKKRLAVMKWAQPFWLEYRRLKPKEEKEEGEDNYAPRTTHEPEPEYSDEERRKAEDEFDAYEKSFSNKEEDEA